MQLHEDSHLDHGLSTAQVDYLLRLFADRSEFFITTIELPEELGGVLCGLFGPIMGDEPVRQADVTHAPRGDRAYSSRLVERPMRPTNKVTVIAGPHKEHACVLYTAFGGPSAPQEPEDITRQIVETNRLLDAEFERTPGYSDATKALQDKLEALSQKRHESVKFWTEHALAR